MPDVHALLSASASSRWLNCPPSARAEEAMPEESTSVYAEEGTRAHALAEKRLNHYLEHGKDIDQPTDCDGEMWESTGRYVDTCVEKITAARAKSPDAEVLVEARLDYSPWVEGGFGTGDVVIVSDDCIEIVDLKYGKGVPVSAVGNTQLRLYALGAYEAYGWAYAAENVRMTIIQPRLDSISDDTMTLKELLSWGDAIKPKARLAWEGKGERKAGEHCRWCKLRAICKTRAEYETQGLKADFDSVPIDEMTKEEMVEWILRKQAIERWLDDIESHVFAKMLGGEDYPKLKLVAGRSSRMIRDTAKAEEKLRGAGYSEEVIFKPRAFQTLTMLEKIVGKKKLATVLDGLIVKPQGKPTIAPIDDKRPTYKREVDPADFDDDDELVIPF